ncbi:MAG TPA: hypothetical protein VNC78_09395 [Actinomycetota bacterium]|nr:hypothetical protein [Actinomycetota bacterium]
MTGDVVYRSLLRLYPAGFRGHYGDDLVQHFADLVEHRGVRAAWTRTGIDLLVTVPRYRLERVMNEQKSATTISITIALLVAAAAVGVLTGLFPGLLFVVLAVGLAVAQRSTLARAIRTPDSDRRHHRLVTSAVLAIVSIAAITTYYMVIGDKWTVRETILTLIGTPAMVGAVVYLIAGLLTPRSPNGIPAHPTA